MDDFDRELELRLAALEATVPAQTDPPSLRQRTRRGRFALSLTMAPVLALAIVATAAGTAVVVSNLVRGYPGVQDPGQPLAGSHMECMTPPEAAAFLAERGFASVVWQVESGDGAKGATNGVEQANPPEHGYVVPGAVLSDGRLHMIIDQRVGASGVGDCFGQPMP
jgi:hypothetical protein